jgi:glutathione synthase/RimK-type ligase-like ATP-grasp enzyme|tara:strand:- start:284 stop:586 length:303 start_codon:yes stop_codon:yes gene_type:complete
MCLKLFAVTLRVKALSAPWPYQNEKGQITFKYENMKFRCMNNPDAITALADRIEKNYKKNFASPMPKPAVVRRESLRVVVRRFIADNDWDNVREFDRLTN